jgi:hypothetical protein
VKNFPFYLSLLWAQTLKTKLKFPTRRKLVKQKVSYFHCYFWRAAKIFSKKTQNYCVKIVLSGNRLRNHATYCTITQPIAQSHNILCNHATYWAAMLVATQILRNHAALRNVITYSTITQPIAQSRNQLRNHATNCAITQPSAITQHIAQSHNILRNHTTYCTITQPVAQSLIALLCNHATYIGQSRNLLHNHATYCVIT